MDTDILLIGAAVGGIVLIVIGVIAFIRHKKKKNVPDEIYPMW